MEYFKHDINASEDDKICDLLASFGFEMLGYYWRFVEYLYSRGGKICKSKINSVAWSLHMDIEKLNILISETDLFVDDGEYIFSKRVLAEVEEFEANGQRLSEAGRKGGKASAKARLEARLEATVDDSSTNGEADAQQKRKKKREKREKREKIIYCSFFDDVWSLYPKKRGKDDVSKAAMEEMTQAGFETVKKAIENYKDELRRNGTEEQFIMYGSTFFNGRWKDYIEPISTVQEQQTPRKKSF